MIFGIGTDVFSPARFLKMAEDEKGFEAFLNRSYSKRELEAVKEGEFDFLLDLETDIQKELLILAGLFSAKEGIFKSLDISSENRFFWSDIEISASKNQLRAELKGNIKEHAKKYNIKNISVNLSFDDDKIISAAISER